MRVIGYTRVSTEEQASDGVSLAAQQEKIRGYAALYDLELVGMAVDAGVSGKTLDRPGLQEALAMLRRGEADGLLIAKLDRLSRSIVDWNCLIDGYFGEKAGKQLFSVADSIDTRTAAGRLVLNVLMSVAQWERETIGERTRDALQHKIRKGERVGKVRYGFRLAEDQKTLVLDEHQQAAIATMRQLRSEGYTLQAIGAELDRQGYRPSEATKWQAMSICKILKRVQA